MNLKVISHVMNLKTFIRWDQLETQNSIWWIWFKHKSDELEVMYHTLNLKTARIYIHIYPIHRNLKAVSHMKILKNPIRSPWNTKSYLMSVKAYTAPWTWRMLVSIPTLWTWRLYHAWWIWRFHLTGLAWNTECRVVKLETYAIPYTGSHSMNMKAHTT